MSKIQNQATQAAELEAAAAKIRADILAAEEAERIRRKPLGDLIDRRLRLIAVIGRNRKILDAHLADAARFEQRADGVFADESAGSLLPIFSIGYVEQYAARAAEMIRVRLEASEKDLARMESEILAFAKRESLQDMIPADLKPA